MFLKVTAVLIAPRMSRLTFHESFCGAAFFFLVRAMIKNENGKEKDKKKETK